MASSTAVGIDLGTTYSCIAVYKNGRPVAVPNTHDTSSTTPSYVMFQNSMAAARPGQPTREHLRARLVGQEAKDGAFECPTNTVFAIKRIIGRKFNEPEVATDMKRWPFSVVSGTDGYAAVQLTENGVAKKISPEEISAEVLKCLVAAAADLTGKVITRAVITVPAGFNYAQKEATKRAGEKAGLTDVTLINEPTAAAVAYGLQNRKPGEPKKTILVFDFGGGTLDVSIMTTENSATFTGNSATFKVLSTVGDMHFGGEDFDEKLLHHLAYEFEKVNGPGMTGSAASMSRLRGQAELVKRALSGNSQMKLVVNSLHGNVNFKHTVTRAQFEELCADLYPKILVPVQRALEGAKLKKEQIDQVVLVGGSSRMPKVVDTLRSFFTAQQIFKDISPDEAIAMGAAAFCHTLVNKSTELQVADIIPHSLGVEIVDGSLVVILPQFSPNCAKLTKDFTTVHDNQTKMNCPIYEGELQPARLNHSWGALVLHDIKPAPAGVPNVPITFEHDASGLLRVRAVETGARAAAEMAIRLS